MMFLIVIFFQFLCLAVLSFLDLWVYAFNQLWTISAIIFSNNFSSHLSLSSFFCDSNYTCLFTFLVSFFFFKSLSVTLNFYCYILNFTNIFLCNIKSTINPIQCINYLRHYGFSSPEVQFGFLKIPLMLLLNMCNLSSRFLDI